MQQLVDEDLAVKVTMAEGEEIATALEGDVPSYIDQVRAQAPRSTRCLILLPDKAMPGSANGRSGLSVRRNARPIHQANRARYHLQTRSEEGDDKAFIHSLLIVGALMNVALKPTRIEKSRFSCLYWPGIQFSLSLTEVLIPFPAYSRKPS